MITLGWGATTEAQLFAFLKTINPTTASEFRDLPRLYREEASIEGVNYDIAFSQMLVETKELTDAQVLAQNNFGGLGSATGGPTGASFPSAKIGVRAQIQHLKAFGSIEPLVLPLVDPRFSFVQVRGIAPLVHMLSGRWNTDPDYGDKIMSYLRKLYGWTVRSSRKINEFARVPAPKVVQGAQSLKRSHNKAYRGSA